MNGIAPCALTVLAFVLASEGVRSAYAPTGSQQPVVEDGAKARRAAPADVIALSYESTGQVSVGQPMDVRVTVSFRHPLTSLTAQVYAHDGLIVTPQNLRETDLEPGESVQWTFRVTPYMDGALRWSLLVQGQVRETIQSGQLTVPVHVGDARSASEPERARSSASAGQSVVSLSARER